MFCPKCGAKLKVKNRAGWLYQEDLYECPKCGSKYLGIFDNFTQEYRLEFMGDSDDR